MERFFGNRSITLYASGTAALAQAMTHCAARAGGSAPEVIIPAYGCPDLVAACVHASVYPRLVDIAPSSWSYDLDSLQSAICGKTVAIVAVNLLGIGDDAAGLKSICNDRHIPLIQDSAQHLPREVVGWPGDYVVLSFGRGKPLNLLHGGALVLPSGVSNTSSARPHQYTPRDRLLDCQVAALAFNALTSPHLYRIASALPGTRLGDVRYKPLVDPAPMADQAWRRVGCAFELYRKDRSYRRDLWEDALHAWSHLDIRALECPGAPPHPEPLRLALLARDEAARDLLVDSLGRAGLGATRFYGSELSAVAGIPEMVQCQGPFPNAASLAGRLFTLPTHDLVNAEDVRRTRAAVLEVLRPKIAQELHRGKHY